MNKEIEFLKELIKNNIYNDNYNNINFFINTLFNEYYYCNVNGEVIEEDSEVINILKQTYNIIYKCIGNDEKKEVVEILLKKKGTPYIESIRLKNIIYVRYN